MGKRGAAVALSLPDNEHCTLRSTILQKVNNQTLTSEKRLPELTKALDEILDKDDIEDCLTKYEDFEDYGRTTEAIAEYIRVFETKNIKTENKGIKLHQRCLHLNYREKLPSLVVTKNAFDRNELLRKR